MISWIPRWRDNPSFNAQAAHLGVGYGVAMTTRYFAPSYLVLVCALAAGVAGLKEFYYDAIYEVPAQSWRDNLTDFTFYCVGLVLGALV